MSENWVVGWYDLAKYDCPYSNRSVCYKTHGKKIPGQKTPRIKNNKAKLDIKHYSKIGQKTLLKKH